jgi:hypothetical protein
MSGALAVLSAGAARGSGASKMLSAETQGLALDFTDSFWYGSTGMRGSARVKDTGTPANNYDSHPFGLLSYASPSVKMCRQSDGLYRYGAHNLCLQSETLASSPWVSANGGTCAANTITDASVSAYAGWQQPVSGLVIGAPYTATYWVKKSDADPVVFPEIQLSIATGGRHYATLNTKTGEVGHRSGGVTEGLDYCESDGNYWKLSLTVVAFASSGNLTIYPAITSSLNGAGNVSLTGYVAVDRVHLRRTPSNSVYLATAGAARYGLPYEWDASGNAIGILVEETRTNLLLFSSDLTNAAWTKTNATPTKTATGPDGVANSASTLTATAGNGVAFQSITSASAARSGSVFLKRRTGTGAVSIAIGETTGSELIPNNDFSTDNTASWSRGYQSVNGILSITGGALTYTIGSGDGAYPRFVLPVTVTAGKLYKATVSNVSGTAGTRYFAVSRSSDGTANTQGTADGAYIFATSGTLYCVVAAGGTAGQTTVIDNVSLKEVAESTVDLSSGAWVRASIENKTITNPILGVKLATSGDAVDIRCGQLENGDKATSPIEAFGAQVTRAADDPRAAQSKFPWNGGTGTLKIDGVTTSPTTSGGDLKIVPRSGQKYITKYLWVPS